MEKEKRFKEDAYGLSSTLVHVSKSKKEKSYSYVTAAMYVTKYDNEYEFTLESDEPIEIMSEADRAFLDALIFRTVEAVEDGLVGIMKFQNIDSNTPERRGFTLNVCKKLFRPVYSMRGDEAADYEVALSFMLAGLNAARAEEIRKYRDDVLKMLAKRQLECADMEEGKEMNAYIPFDSSTISFINGECYYTNICRKVNVESPEFRGKGGYTWERFCEESNMAASNEAIKKLAFDRRDNWFYSEMLRKFCYGKSAPRDDFPVLSEANENSAVSCYWGTDTPYYVHVSNAGYSGYLHMFF